MEILSIGEKIKRARIYKGYTLKDLCDGRISVSKMSCIENDKVKPEEQILYFIAEKLDLDLNYLKEDVEKQLTKNLILLDDRKRYSNYEDILKYNIKIAKEYGYFNIAFRIFHKLFNYYLDISEEEKVKNIIFEYYDLCQKSKLLENRMIYFMDIGQFLFLEGEFIQASNYYNSVKKELKGKEYVEILARAVYKEAVCYIIIGDMDKACENEGKLIELVDYIDDELMKAKIYHMLGMFSIKNKNMTKFQYYEEKSYENYGDNIYEKLQTVYNFATVMFKVGFNEKATEYVNYVIQEYPKDNKEKVVKFTLDNIKLLIENNMIDTAQKICDEVLNYSIDLDNLKYIEQTYHYKALILSKQNNLASAEMYMNLSLDALTKVGSKVELYNRYMEMGDIYHIFGCVSESIKYFSLAMSLEKKI